MPKASGSDRLTIRGRLIELGADVVPPLIAELETGNHLLSENAALVLGELRDKRAVEPLARVASEATRGHVTSAALALGRIADPETINALTLQLLSGHAREGRRAAALALGRLRHPEAVARLREQLRECKQEGDRAALIAALGMSGSALAVGDLLPLMKATDDRTRRCAAAALACLPASPESIAALLSHLSDEDDLVRLSVLDGLALSLSPPQAAEVARKASLAAHSDDRTRAGVCLVAGARGGAAMLPYLLARVSDSASSEKIRAAAVGSIIGAAEPFGDELVALGLKDRHGDVRKIAVIAGAVLDGRRKAQTPPTWFLVDDERDAGVRDVALLAYAWLNGVNARETLGRIIAAQKEDRLVERAQSLLRLLEGPPGLAHKFIRAHLQVALDDTGAAPSWNVHRAINTIAIEALGLEKALPELAAGGGAAAGAGAEDRAKAAALRKIPPDQEDMRRHLDRYPFSDWRDSVEVPLLR